MSDISSLLSSDISDIVNSLLSDPSILDGADQETTVALLRKLQFTGGEVKTEEEKRKQILFGLANFRESYYRNFAITATTGFMYRVAKEHSVRRDLRTFDLDAIEKSKEVTKPFTPDEFAKRHQYIQKLNEELQNYYKVLIRNSVILEEVVKATAEGLAPTAEEVKSTEDDVAVAALAVAAESAVEVPITEAASESKSAESAPAAEAAPAPATTAAEAASESKSAPATTEAASESKSAPTPAAEAASESAREASRRRTILQKTLAERMVYTAESISSVRESELSGLIGRKVQKSKVQVYVTREEAESELANIEEMYNYSMFLNMKAYEDFGQNTHYRFGAEVERLLNTSAKSRIKYDETARKHVKYGTYELPEEVARKTILEFLNQWFEFDVDEHVRCVEHNVSHVSKISVPMPEHETVKILVDKDDPHRLTHEQLLASTPKWHPDDAPLIAKLTSSAELYNAALHVLRYPENVDVLRTLSTQADFLAKNEKLLDMSLDTSELGRISHRVAAERCKLEYGMHYEESPMRFVYLLKKLTAGEVEHLLVHAERIFFEIALIFNQTPARESIIHSIPMDTFYRLGFYIDSNYESLVSATEACFADKKHLEFAINIQAVHEGTESELKEQYETFKRENEKSLITNLYAVGMKGWTALSSIRKNREKLDFYNSNTEVMRRIIKARDEDAQMGRELLKKRVEKAKATNIAEYGPDDPKLSRYRGYNSALGAMGVTKVITDREMRILAAAEGDRSKARTIKEVFDMLEHIRELEIKKTRSGLTLDEENDLAETTAAYRRQVDALGLDEKFIQAEVIITDAAKNVIKTTDVVLPAAAPTSLEGEVGELLAAKTALGGGAAASRR